MDYYHSKILGNESNLDSWHKDNNGPFESIVNPSAFWWKKELDFKGWPRWRTASLIDKHYK